MASERYRDPEETVDDRVKDLLGRMSTEEKLGQLSALAVPLQTFDSAEDALDPGVGFVELGAVLSADGVQATADAINELQHWLLHNTRLGIPALVHANVEAGLDALGAVRFPEGLGLVSTFSPDAARTRALEIRAQLRALGVRLARSPMLDIGRDPRWQHIEHSVGEDPYLAGRMAVACVRGLQGELLADGVAAMGKHYVGYGLSVGGLPHAPVHLGRRQLREVFVEPFAAAIRDADLACVMCAPNSVDGLPVSASKVMLSELLREDLGFEGLVVSDDHGLELLVSQHGVAASTGDAAAAALNAGLDVELPQSVCFAAPLKEQLETQRIDMKVLNRAVRRVLRLKFRLGLFEEPMVDATQAAGSFATPKQHDIARGLAAKSMVLLKNDAQCLPLAPNGNIGVIGPCINQWGATSAQGERQNVSALQGIELRVGEKASVRGAPGCGVDTRDDALLAEAVQLGRNSDVIVLMLGGGGGQFTDAGRLDLPAAQLELLAALEPLGVPIVCVLACGRIYALEALVERVQALVLAWSPGAQGGAALADLLFGDLSFSGRLPVSLVRHVGQVPAYYNRKAGGRVDAQAAPLFPFGFGLSYSAFDYTDLQCPESVDTHGVLRIAFELTNTGALDADEIVQLYARDHIASVARPLRQLIGFNRVSVPAGETITCKFRIDLSQFAYFDEAMSFAVEPGDVDVLIGSSSEDIRLQQTVRLTGDRRELSQRQIVATQATAP